MVKQKSHILPIIILSQFACTSTWFAGNAILESLTKKLDFGAEIIGYVLSSVQFGFIIGTLLFGILMIADRFSPSRVFMLCAFLASLSNLFLILPNLSVFGLMLARFSTGFFLAGIYPVGMKIAADYYEKGLGKALGFLVGALVLGTAFPFLINGTSWGSHPDSVIKITSSITAIGGLLLFVLVPNGPYRVVSPSLKLDAGPKLFKNSEFRKAAFGYFGHMWELYAFWAFTPVAIFWFNRQTGGEISIPLWTGIIIALGGASCAFGGMVSQKIGSKKVAMIALSVSGLLCVASPLLLSSPAPIFLLGWCLWGIAVTADSPQFSNLVASSVTPELKGTALTLVNCIGFAITILSIQLLGLLQNIIPIYLLFIPLAIGPILGVYNLMDKKVR
ncbi:MFS transporter [Maribacter arcticus]|uniref:Predicted arabinose efflux permease, MFS family n=1 Tax=Maribacter arcticus TaxID=561365 RepID=A0A1T5E2A7_9FLAO|nr:MFS transporter [Maribacter arcticus]SKB78148.1 Predicted arabinose efflux permease, MFS family [Maribacter arcticus]|tara:strand:- start:189 stop:1358 length:1170 start_codon:yes stop_codon:yes gene_type:complete